MTKNTTRPLIRIARHLQENRTAWALETLTRTMLYALGAVAVICALILIPTATVIALLHLTGVL